MEGGLIMDEEFDKADESLFEDKLDEQEEIDHLSKFMFGTNRTFNKNPNNNSIEFPRERQRRKGDAWILGYRKEEQEEESVNVEENSNMNAIANYISQIDLELLMKNVDMFMTSANELKPLIKKVTPLLKKWMD